MGLQFRSLEKAKGREVEPIRRPLWHRGIRMGRLNVGTRKTLQSLPLKTTPSTTNAQLPTANLQSPSHPIPYGHPKIKSAHTLRGFASRPRLEAIDRGTWLPFARSGVVM